MGDAILLQDKIQNHANVKDGKAIQGYDPVAYFKHMKAVKGNVKHAMNFQGSTYLFSSEENRRLFMDDPVKYEPQYGGWCAYAMGEDGSKVKIDPTTFKIVDGKLYLFYNFLFTNTLPKWNKDEENLMKQADTNWARILADK